MTGTLFVVATPLGHLGDLSSRAADTLRTVPVVAAEDTRHSRKLLAHLDAHPALVSIHQHVPAARLAQLVARLVGGTDMALVTDAGTPAVSDPGASLVAAARAAGVPVVPIPGPSAVAAALSASGFPADRYLFLGFLDRKGPERRAQLAQAVTSPSTVVIFEAANRLGVLLRDLAGAGHGERGAVVAREITKIHEEFKAGTLTDLAAYYDEHVPKGEVTVVVAGRGQRGQQGQQGQEEPGLRAGQVATRLLAAGLSKRDVVKALQETMDLSRNDAYQIVTELDA